MRQLGLVVLRLMRVAPCVASRLPRATMGDCPCVSLRHGGPLRREFSHKCLAGGSPLPRAGLRACVRYDANCDVAPGRDPGRLSPSLG